MNPKKVKVIGQNLNLGLKKWHPSQPQAWSRYHSKKQFGQSAILKFRMAVVPRSQRPLHPAWVTTQLYNAQYGTPPQPKIQHDTIYCRVIVKKFCENITMTIHYKIENYTVRRIYRHFFRLGTPSHITKFT